ncbi:hypothetical protein [Scytonema sp. PRP1]|uniref:hypothetical protein n=1 Tax=Scytonema sp. PRP1 TaxID=3120513 RepID=UPI000BBC5C50
MTQRDGQFLPEGNPPANCPRKLQRHAALNPSRTGCLYCTQAIYNHRKAEVQTNWLKKLLILCWLRFKLEVIRLTVFAHNHA